jgi:hypothetical protein
MARLSLKIIYKRIIKFYEKSLPLNTLKVTVYLNLKYINETCRSLSGELASESLRGYNKTDHVIIIIIIIIIIQGKEEKEDVQEKRGWKMYKQP